MDTETTAFRPPYMSFQTFWKFIEELASKPLPPRIDRSIMKSKSGTDQANLTMALTSFGFTDSEGNVKPPLSELVGTPADERAKAFGDLIRQHYAGPLRVSSQNGTPADLNAAFNDDYPSIASADTRRKSITFFLHAATHAGIELSPHFPPTRPGSGAPGASKVKRSAPRRKPASTADGNDSPSQGRTTNSGGHTQTVTLKSGGKVTLTYDVNMFEVTDEDEAFVLDLIKKLRSYRSAASAGTESVAEDGS